MVEQFLARLGDEEKVLFWLQSRRIERTLIKAGFPIGPAATLGARPDQIDSLYVGNLSGPRSRFISVMSLILDLDAQILLPRDLTLSEIYKLPS
ncbi:hypothetical protein [Lacipirellula parvula]|uniref:Uncharacterized protein n=1 Tax=Lacipirellula parvula TaxID=2650471 RepID=A0A5K7X6P7_9BACT|nr:hypothetical protein [Lacipirellula parvula]BBO32260.1 hypothetical protein PLANPX_1872 [Lacipirellula parvula]